MKTKITRALSILALSMIVGIWAAAGAVAATLHWDTSTGTVTGYRVHYGTSPGAPSNTKDVGNTTSYNLDSLPLSENTQYYFCVSAYNSAGESATCPPVAYTPGDSTPPVPPVGLVASVSDGSAPSTGAPVLSNLSVASGKTYRIQTGLANGKTVYIDRSFTFSTIPDQLNGAAFIMTANDDKAYSSTKLVSFSVNRNATVYVAHDDRIATKPEWLKGFTKTSMRLKSDVPMTVYQKSFAAGTVSLGGNNGSRLSSMYCIAVK